MTDSDDDSRVAHPGKGLLEFTYRFLTVLLDKELITTAEALDFSVGVGRALETGRVTHGLIEGLQVAMERSEVRRISSSDQ